MTWCWEAGVYVLVLVARAGIFPACTHRMGTYKRPGSLPRTQTNTSEHIFPLDPFPSTNTWISTVLAFAGLPLPVR